MAGRSIFYEEWRACLRSHYAFVVRMDDQVTERSLRVVLSDTGFSEEEIAAIYEQARAEAGIVDAPVDESDISKPPAVSESEVAVRAVSKAPPVEEPNDVEPSLTSTPEPPAEPPPETYNQPSLF